MAYFINDKCTSCGACIVECPTVSIIIGKTQYYIDADTCDSHAACAAVCPVEAIAPLKVKPPERFKISETEEDEEEGR